MTDKKHQTSSDTEHNVAEINVNSAKTEVLTTLKDHFLIAMPTLTDPYFKKSVVYLCEHDKDGAMGFIINFPVKLTLQELLSNVETIKHQPEPHSLAQYF